MQFYHHDFDDITGYLHHRPPYLLIDQVDLLQEREIVTSKKLTGEEFFFQGHFPGAPILPGALMQEMTTQSAGVLIAARYNPMKEFNTHDPFFNEFALGVLVKVGQSRFRGFARPGDQLTIRVLLNEVAGFLFDFSAAISVEDREIMRNSFRLTNIRSKVLQGETAV